MDFFARKPSLAMAETTASFDTHSIDSPAIAPDNNQQAHTSYDGVQKIIHTAFNQTKKGLFS